MTTPRGYIGAVFGMRVVQVDESTMRDLLVKAGTPDLDPATSYVLLADREMCAMAETIEQLRAVVPEEKIPVTSHKEVEP